MSKDGDREQLLRGTTMTSSKEGPETTEEGKVETRDPGTQHTWTKSHVSTGFTVWWNVLFQH